MKKLKLYQAGITVLLLCSIFCQGQEPLKSESTFSVGPPMKVPPCKMDTIKGLLYLSFGNGGETIFKGYYIAPCGSLQVKNVSNDISNIEQEKIPIWIPGTILWCEAYIDSHGPYFINYKLNNNFGYFTDEHFKKIETKRVYGLLVERKK